jgi:hypothetical protein
MGKQEDKKPFLDTIKLAPWILGIYLTVFFATFYSSVPELWVYWVSLTLGGIVSVTLPFVWRRGINWAGQLIFMPPAIYFTIEYGVIALQVTLLSLSVTSVVWLVFKSKFIGYINHST